MVPYQYVASKMIPETIWMASGTAPPSIHPFIFCPLFSSSFLNHTSLHHLYNENNSLIIPHSHIKGRNHERYILSWYLINIMIL